MSLYPKILLNTQFELVEIDGEVTAVSVGDNNAGYNGVILLKNESTQFMFEKLQEGITLPELIKACMDKYPGSSVEEVGPQVLDFLKQMEEQKLISVDIHNGIKIED